MDRQTDRLMEIWMEIWMEERRLEIPSCVVQEIGSLGSLEKDNSVNKIGVLRLLRTVGMDGWMGMDGH